MLVNILKSCDCLKGFRKGWGVSGVIGDVPHKGCLLKARVGRPDLAGMQPEACSSSSKEFNTLSYDPRKDLETPEYHHSCCRHCVITSICTK